MHTDSRLLLPLRLFLAACIAVVLGIQLTPPWGVDFTRHDRSDWLVACGFLLWTASPLAMLAAGAGLFRRAGPAMAVFAAGSALVAGVGLAVYAGAMHDLDPQFGLVFVFVPLAQWAAALGLVGVCLLLRWWLRRR